jgi:hypothetical protein
MTSGIFAKAMFCFASALKAWTYEKSSDAKLRRMSGNRKGVFGKPEQTGSLRRGSYCESIEGEAVLRLVRGPV